MCWIGRQSSFRSSRARSVTRWWSSRRICASDCRNGWPSTSRQKERCVFESLEAAASTAGENIIVFGNEFFDALPVEVVDYRGALRIGVENGKFVETFDPPTAAEAEFLDRYSVHPEEGERVEATLMSLRVDGAHRRGLSR